VWKLIKVVVVNGINEMRDGRVAMIVSFSSTDERARMKLRRIKRRGINEIKLKHHSFF